MIATTRNQKSRNTKQQGQGSKQEESDKPFHPNTHAGGSYKRNVRYCDRYYEVSDKHRGKTAKVRQQATVK